MSGEKQVGNVAAMREALEAADKALSLISKSAWFVDANFNETIEVMDAGKKIESALALPLRNCDVGTAEEQANRFKDFCRFRACSDCPAGKSSADIIECEFAWARMPYTEEGGAS